LKTLPSAPTKPPVTRSNSANKALGSLLKSEADLRKQIRGLKQKRRDARNDRIRRNFARQEETLTRMRNNVNKCIKSARKAARSSDPRAGDRLLVEAMRLETQFQTHLATQTAELEAMYEEVVVNHPGNRHVGPSWMERVDWDVEFANLEKAEPQPRPAPVVPKPVPANPVRNVHRPVKPAPVYQPIPSETVSYPSVAIASRGSAVAAAVRASPPRTVPAPVKQVHRPAPPVYRSIQKFSYPLVNPRVRASAPLYTQPVTPCWAGYPMNGPGMVNPLFSMRTMSTGTDMYGNPLDAVAGCA